MFTENVILTTFHGPEVTLTYTGVLMMMMMMMMMTMMMMMMKRHLKTHSFTRPG